MLRTLGVPDPLVHLGSLEAGFGLPPLPSMVRLVPLTLGPMDEWGRTPCHATLQVSTRSGAQLAPAHFRRAKRAG